MKISHVGAARSFTLVELLVVVAILGLLAGLGVPAIRKGMEVGRSAKCAANLRTIGVAVQQFAAEHNGRILTWGLYPQNQDGFYDEWFQGLAATITGGKQEIEGDPGELNKLWKRLSCPEVGEKYCSWHYACYAANSFQDPPWGHSRVLMQRIEKPSQTIYLVDGWVTFAAYAGIDLTDPGWPPPGNWPGGPLGGPPKGNCDRWIYFPHGGKCNALFLDGHVESFSGRIPSKFIRP